MRPPRGWNLRRFTCELCSGRGWTIKDGVGVACAFCKGETKFSLRGLADRFGTTYDTLEKIWRPRKKSAGVDPSVCLGVLNAIYKFALPRTPTRRRVRETA